MEVLMINKQEVSDILSMETCIDLMTETFKTLAEGNSIQPLRSAMWLPDKSGWLGLMPAYASDTKVMGIKVVSVFPQNHDKGLSSHQGAVLLFETETGEMYAIIDGDRVTGIRTAAVSAVATKLLAREDVEDLTILGSGEQATRHLEAMLLIRDIKRVKVWSRNHEHALAFVKTQTPNYKVSIEAMEDAREAVLKADIICTCTAAKEPVLRSEWVRDGVHINAVGACTAGVRELDSDLVARSILFTDKRESLFNESGDFLFPMKEGLFGEEHLKGELGEFLSGGEPARKTEKDITLFKSLGLAVEDLSACHYIYEKAKEMKRGKIINL
ncbi:MAG: ornithine cyclodeaminase family protein [Bacteroidetes bacterium]|nr:ornithine cyclodeaminase family protein [Bacteroidota bacterium]